MCPLPRREEKETGPNQMTPVQIPLSEVAVPSPVPSQPYFSNPSPRGRTDGRTRLLGGGEGRGGAFVEGLDVNPKCRPTRPRSGTLRVPSVGCVRRPKTEDTLVFHDHPPTRTFPSPPSPEIRNGLLRPGVVPVFRGFPGAPVFASTDLFGSTECW